MFLLLPCVHRLKNTCWQICKPFEAVLVQKKHLKLNRATVSHVMCFTLSAKKAHVYWDRCSQAVCSHFNQSQSMFTKLLVYLQLSDIIYNVYQSFLDMFCLCTTSVELCPLDLCWSDVNVLSCRHAFNTFCLWLRSQWATLMSLHTHRHTQTDRQVTRTAFGLQATGEWVTAVEWSVTETRQRSLHQWCQTVTELQLIIYVNELVDALTNQVILTPTNISTHYNSPLH